MVEHVQKYQNNISLVPQKYLISRILHFENATHVGKRTCGTLCSYGLK